MENEQKLQIIKEAIDSYNTLQNSFNYSSFKKAETITELSEGKDSFGNKVFAWKNLINHQVFFGDPSFFNDKDEFMFYCPEEEWKEFLFSNPLSLSIFNEKNLSIDEFEQELSPNQKIILRNRRLALKQIAENTPKKIKKKFGIFCLAPSPYNAWFWRSYCDDYNGICCKYNTTSITGLKQNGAFIKKVEYNDEKIAYLPQHITTSQVVNIIKKINPEMANKIGTDPKGQEEICFRLMSKKYKEWESEYENRLIMKCVDINGDERYCRTVSATPIEIYVGNKVNGEIYQCLESFCKNENIPLRIVNESDCFDFKEFINTDYFKNNNK